MDSWYSFEFEDVLICWCIFCIQSLLLSVLALSKIFLVNKSHETTITYVSLSLNDYFCSLFLAPQSQTQLLLV